MLPSLQACFLVLAFATCSLASDPVYELQQDIGADLTVNNQAFISTLVESFMFSNEENYEWESYDGWFNNAAHVNWGGFGK
jgi:hypothetical protein